MPYTPVNFQDGVTPLNAATMNKLDDALEDLYTNPAAALTYEGDHVPATSYQDGDIVVKDGIAYLCVGGPTTAAPNPVPWGPAGMMSGYIKTTDKGVANGVASLDANVKVPQAQLPAYQTYTPTWTADGAQPAIGNGVLTGRWTQVGKFVHCTVRLQIGSTSTFGTGNWYFGAPAPIAGNSLGHVALGSVWLYDSSTVGFCIGVITAVSSTALLVRYLVSPGPVSTQGFATGTTPWAWAAGDECYFQVMYEGA